MPKGNNELKRGFARSAPLLLLVSFSLQAAQLDVAAVGPVDAVSCRQRSVTVLGVTFTATTKTAVDAICTSNARPGLTYLSALGTPSNKGIVELKSLSLVSAEGYVSGATDVYLRGVVTHANPLTGEFSISGAVVSANGPTPSVGSYVELVGSRPSPNGVVLSTAVVAVGVNSSAGTGKQSSAGTGKQSSAGTGKQSSAGTGALSSAGTGALSSAGTGKQSSAGTGKQSSAGTGKQSSAGTGALSSAGTGALSSAGTGKQSSAGTGKQSSAGTGKQSSARTGAFSSAGTGALSSAGTGAALE